jgi:hypothetical protein
MGLAVATTVAFCAWVVLWAIGWKPMDAFLITAVIILIAGTVKSLSAFLPGSHETEH